MTLGRLLIKIGADSSELERALDKSLEKFDNFSSAINRVGTRLTLGLTLPLAGLATVGIRSAQQLETFASSLRVLIGDVERANAVFDELYQFSAGSPFDWKSLSNATRLLAAFGTEAEEIVPTLRRVGDIAAGVDMNIADLAESYGKAKVQGRLMGQDLNRFTGQGIPLIQEFAKQFGIAESEVREMAASGAISFANLEQAFISLTSEGGKFFRLTEELAGTSAGKLNQLKDEFEQVTDIIGARLLPVFDKLVVAAKDATKWFVELDEETQNAIVAFGVALAIIGPLTLAIGGLATAIGFLKIAIGASLLPALVGGGALLAALLVLSQRFIKNQLDAAGAADSVDNYTNSLKGLNREQLMAATLANSMRIDALRQMPQTSFVKDAIAGAKEEGLKLAAAYNAMIPPSETVAENASTTANELAKIITPLERAYEEASRLGMALQVFEDSPARFAEAQRRAMTLLQQTVDLADQLPDFSMEGLEFRGIAKRMGEAIFAELRDMPAPDVTVPVNLVTEGMDLSLKDLPDYDRFTTDQLRAMWAQTEAYRRTVSDLQYFGNEMRIRAEQLKNEFTDPGTTAEVGLQMAGQSALQLAAALGPLGIIAHFLSTVMEGLWPVVDALLYPITLLAEALLPALTSVMAILFPVIKGVAIVLTIFGQLIFTVMGGIANAVGSLIHAIGTFIKRIIRTDLGLQSLGNAIKDVGNGYKETAEALAEARRDLWNMDFDTAMERTANNMEKLNSAVIGAVHGFKTAGLAHRAANPLHSPSPTAKSGGEAQDAKVIIQGATFAPTITIQGSGDGSETYGQLYEEIERLTRGRGPSDPSRLFFESLPVPV